MAKEEMLIYDDQPQMMGAREDTETYAIRRVVIRDAFAAIDREALIEKLAQGHYEGVRGQWGIKWEHAPRSIKVLQRKGAERGLVKVGILPERES